MPNPLFNGNAGNMANAASMASVTNAMGNINPQAIQQIMAMINRGADIKDVIVSFKKSGLSPQVIEQALSVASPQFKQLKQQLNMMKQSGMSQQDVFASLAKQANVDPNQLNATYENLIKLVR